MSRVNGKVIKRAACFLAAAALCIPLTVKGTAADSDTLYFGALEEKVAQNVKTTKVTKGEFFVTGAVQGSLEFSSNQYVMCDVSEGVVHFQEMLVSQGDTVKKGDPIASIYVTVDEIEKEEVQRNLDAARKNLDEYKADTRLLLNQYKKALNQGSERDRRLAQISYDRLYDSYKKELEKREARIDEYVIRLAQIESIENTKTVDAPTDGVIGFTNRMRKGEVLGRWSFLCAINDPSNVRVVVEGGSDLLRYNMPVKIVQSTGNRNVELTGRVVTMKSTAASVNLMARNDIIEIYGDVSTLMPGADVSVKFDKIYVEDALIVPKNALKSDKKGQYLNVYINGFSSKRYVVVGGADSMNYWIVFGVEEGDTIILE
ncbi:MAG: efflux RND transporter periplasmic adaptor subunit [Lachnospiraceae bacterium]|jgi:multidrug efflux pump subunit AcrA (membrane-fusion protein)|nr:efflux RND transporter periplasmic adaptor subunit [Lachnospiraceae bacterium]